MARVAIDKLVRFVPERTARIMALVVSHAERLSSPEKVKLTVYCAGKNVRAEITEFLQPPPSG